MTKITGFDGICSTGTNKRLLPGILPYLLSCFNLGFPCSSVFVLTPPPPRFQLLIFICLLGAFSLLHTRVPFARVLYRIVPQKEHEVLHFTRSYSGRSLTHIPSAGWTTKSISTQTEEKHQGDAVLASNSLKRIPRWKRTRLRKSIAVMESSQGRREASWSDFGAGPAFVGIVNPGFSYAGSPPGGISAEWPDVQREGIEAHLRHEETARRSRQLYSTSDIPDTRHVSSAPIRGCSSVDNLLDRDRKLQENFMLKYRQVSGDLRSSCDLVELARQQEAETRDKCLIESKTVRKEKKKKRWRHMSADRLVDERSAASWRRERSADQAQNIEDDCGGLSKHCYINPGLESSPLFPATLDKENQAPLARQELCDLSPVPVVGGLAPFSRQSKYNNSYRLATNQPATPAQRLGHLPRTSTQICLDPAEMNSRQRTTKHHLLRQPHHPPVPSAQEAADDCLYVRAEPYLCSNSEASRASTVSDVRGGGRGEELYTRPGPFGPLQRYTVSGILGGLAPPPGARSEDAFRRHSAARLSRCSQATADSGRYSDLRQVFSDKIYPTSIRPVLM